jgi:hypothetical protein
MKNLAPGALGLLRCLATVLIAGSLTGGTVAAVARHGERAHSRHHRPYPGERTARQPFP